ncbi:MAG: hypothetical protein V1907_04700 [Candidatus Kerfeldbacteria bacterium]
MTTFRQRLFIRVFNVATILLMVGYVVEFVTKGRWIIPNTVAEVFLLVLVFYAGDKELHRWHHKHTRSYRRGELFVFAWAVLGIMMFVIESIGGNSFGYHVPKDIPLVIWSVIVIYIITEYLKSEFHKK